MAKDYPRIQMLVQVFSKLIKIGFLLLCVFALRVNAGVSDISLKDHYPQKYVVEEGDSLYEIADMYLKKPWQWRRIWRNNPHIHNPRRLYPGAILELEYYDGYPHLRVTSRGTYKISPHARPRPAKHAIPPIHLSDIKPFLNGSRIFDRDELSGTPYVVGFAGEHLLGTEDSEIYVKDLKVYEKSNLDYAVYRPDGVYTSPIKPHPIIGYIATLIGHAQLLEAGAPSTLVLTSITQAVRIKDRVLINNHPEYDLYFEPTEPVGTVHAEVIDVLGGLTQVASDQVIVINSGKKQGLKPGVMLSIWQHSRVVEDPMDKKGFITLPKEHVGLAMVFRAFTQTSYALVVHSTRAVNKGDTIENP